ncbi:zinc transporter ZIP6 [Zeugodacus cucurbitae]|uniref:zinc transporter ZIP6 n=1 Tax=Zeugodacus cucurbitae TaxID=28588 RepID=UPI0023D9462D|nr:zinc transporter ZIP6 [Zeugodacus cucurbitae]
MASSALAHIFGLIFVCFLCGTIQQSHAATEYNRYLAHIFQKYGTGGTISFEGLEHLMYNLGLGQIEFEPEHTIDEHRPKGFKIDNEQLAAYFEQQSLKFLPTGEDIQVLTQRNAQGKVSDELDILIKEKEKGILLEFKEMHDPKHRHPRDSDASLDAAPSTANVCLSPKSMLRLVVDHNDLHKRKLYKTYTADDITKAHNSEDEYNEFINHVQLTPVAFMKLCPALLAQIDQHVCLRPAPLTNGEDPKQALWNAWIYASVSIFILSACGLLGILLVPLMKTIAYQEILKFLVAVAIGTLAGDALMHLLPHALVPEHEDKHNDEHAVESEHDEHEAVWICACAFFTCIFMYCLEHILPLLRGDSAGGHGHGHAHGGHKHGHGHVHGSHAHGSHAHTHAHHTKHAHHTELAPSEKAADSTSNSNANIVSPVNSEAKEINIMLNETKKDEKTPNRPLTPVAFMVVIGDGLHNLTDGLAIGAAFASDPVTGMATAFAVLCHELPHELGDFALLLQTGVSLRRAIYLNIVSSVLSFLGMAIGLFIAGAHGNMTQWIYACTAGSFLYIALADLVPAMSEVEAHAGDAKSKLKGTLIQICGMLLGGFIMLAIAVNEHELSKLFK